MGVGTMHGIAYLAAQPRIPALPGNTGTVVALALTLLLSTSAFRPSTGDRVIELLSPGGSELTYGRGRFGNRLLDADSASRADRTGRALYFRNWLSVVDDAGPLAGPDLDAGSCATCHSETDPGSRGMGPRVAVPVRAMDEARYGPQLSTAYHGGGDRKAPLARLQITWERDRFTYPDGTSRDLRRPRVSATMRSGERIPAALRATPLLFGWGLMAQVPVKTLAAFTPSAR